jgi:tetratricopeptide (TPR) repeat protein
MTAPSSSAESAPPRVPRSKRRVWAFRAMTVALALVLVGGCEVSLRWVGVGQDFDLIEAAPGHPAKLGWQLNPSIDRVYFGGREMQGPEPRRFDLPKPDDVYRIVFLGESTVIGFPYASEIAFPRQVEVLLEAQQPGLNIEVLNAGITAINCFEIADLAKRCRACEPDLVVVHAGHNEFFGPGGPASTVLPLPPTLVDWTFAVRRLRMAQLWGGLFSAPSSDGRHPLESLPRLTNVRSGDPEFRQAAENYRRNLQRTITSLHEQAIPVLLSTVACNLRDQGPIHNVWPAHMPDDESERLTEVIAKSQRLLMSDQPADALALLEAIEPQANSSALFQYRLGQTLERLARGEDASEAYRLARDYDGCRFRAPSLFGEIVRELAGDPATQQTPLLDIETIVAAHSRDGTPGRELFLEHVHYNLRGQRLLAREFARAIRQKVMGREWQASREITDSEVDAEVGLLREDAVSGGSFGLEALETPPLADSIDNMAALAAIRAEIARDYALLSPMAQERFASLSMQTLQHELVDGLARAAVRQGEYSAAQTLGREAVRRRPYSPQAWLLLAHIEAHGGFTDPARGALDEVLKLDASCPDAVRLQRSLAKDEPSR